MRIYVCWDSAVKYPVIGDHVCGIAAKAVVDAGYDPEIKRAYGWKNLPALFNQTPGRRQVKQLTGSYEVPVLVLDDGTAIAGSQEIVAWAAANPAQTAPARTAA